MCVVYYFVRVMFREQIDVFIELLQYRLRSITSPFTRLQRLTLNPCATLGNLLYDNSRNLLRA